MFERKNVHRWPKGFVFPALKAGSPLAEVDSKDHPAKLRLIDFPPSVLGHRL